MYTAKSSVLQTIVLIKYSRKYELLQLFFESSRFCPLHVITFRAALSLLKVEKLLFIERVNRRVRARNKSSHSRIQTHSAFLMEDRVQDEAPASEDEDSAGLAAKFDVRLPEDGFRLKTKIPLANG